MSEKTEFTRKDYILLSVSLVSSIVSPIIVAIFAGTGRFSNFKPTTAQWLGLLLAFVVFIVTTVFLIAKWRSTLEFISLLMKIIVSNWQLILGFALLLATLWGIYLTNSYWIMLNALGFTVAVGMLYRYFVVRKESKFAASEAKFIPVLIPPGMGNKYFGQFYLDFPSGDVLLRGAKFHLQPMSLVFDTSSQIREHYLRDDGCKEIKLSLPKPIKSIKSIHVLINSGNSKSFYKSEKVGEIKLIFDDIPPITTDLILGKNLREWCIGAPSDLVREFSDPLSTVVWQGVNKEGIYAVVDSLEIPVHEVVKSNALQQIVFIHRPLQRQGDTLGVQYFVSAIALEIDRNVK